jgi:aspartate oxidase
VERAAAAAGRMLVARSIVMSALRREESRGAHCRVDFPEEAPEWKANLVHCLEKGKVATRLESV